MLGALTDATRPMRINPDVYHPMIVIGCAIENGIRRDMLSNKARFAMRANANDAPLMDNSLVRG